MITGFIVLSIIAKVTSAHSWVECTNYDPVSFDYESLGEFDRSRCNGYPRGFERQFNEGYSIDTGFDWEYPNCRNEYDPSFYNEELVMPTYTAGQTIYISHPAKNHVEDTCTGPIPSEGMNVYMSSEPEVDTFDISLELIDERHSLGTVDHLGFQRCYKFCENKDSSHCLTGWIIPADTTPGRHSFQWMWQFNVGQFYTNCFDANVISSDGTTPSPTVINDSGMMNNSNSDSGMMSGSGMTPTPSEDPTIEFPSPTPSEDLTIEFPSPTPSEDLTTETPSQSPTETPSQSPTETPSQSPTEAPSPDFNVISNNSGSGSLNNPIGDLLKSISFNVSAVLEMTGIMNITYF